MSKSIKLKNNNYWDSDSVVHNKISLKTLLNKINSSVTNYILDTVDVTNTASAKTVLTVTIPETGIYLFTGFASPNYFGQSGRELSTYAEGANPSDGTYQSTDERIDNVGGGQPHNNMPPYLTVYMWYRTA